MNNAPVEAIESLWAEFVGLRSQQAMFSAMVRLGEIDQLLRGQPAAAVENAQMRNRLDSLSFTTEELQRAQAQAHKALQQVQRILAVGEKFIYEEWLLVITLRVTLELFDEFSSARNFCDRIDFRSVDEEIHDAAVLSQNAAAFASAQRSARSNWGVPLSSKWLA